MCIYGTSVLTGETLAHRYQITLMPFCVATAHITLQTVTTADTLSS